MTSTTRRPTTGAAFDGPRRCTSSSRGGGVNAIDYIGAGATSSDGLDRLRRRRLPRPLVHADLLAHGALLALRPSRLRPGRDDAVLGLGARERVQGAGRAIVVAANPLNRPESVRISVRGGSIRRPRPAGPVERRGSSGACSRRAGRSPARSRPPCRRRASSRSSRRGSGYPPVLYVTTSVGVGLSGRRRWRG